MFSYLNLKHFLLGIIFTLFIYLPSLANDLNVSFIDIGQGDSELIELPDGTNIMIDAGDKDGSAKLISYLKERKVKKLDLVIITHPHIDHYGGLLQAVKVFPVGQVFDSGAPTTSTTYLRLLKEFAAKKVKFKISRKGDQINYGNGITLNILAPEDPLLKGTRSDTNNASIVAKLTYNKISFLFTGDMEAESQDKILKENPLELKANILKVAHHGSRYTSSSNFLNAVNPEVAMISCGTGNSYGHPHQETLKRLAENKINVYRTDQKGTIIVSSDGLTYKINNINAPVAKAVRVLPPIVIKEKPVGKVIKVNINTATMKELVALPGIGEKTAQRIINGRPYKTVEDLEKVSGISKNQIKKIIGLFVVN